MNFGFGKRQKPLVLCIDDHEMSYPLVQDVLNELNCDSLYAPGANEGILMAEKQKPDVILLDYNMPEIDGPSACTIIKNNPLIRDIPILMLTSIDTIRDIDRAMAAGASGYIVKPVMLERLKPKLESLLQGKF